MSQYRRLGQMVGIFLLVAVVTLSCQFGPAPTARQVTGGEQAARPSATQPADEPKPLPSDTAAAQAPARPTTTPTSAAEKSIQTVAAEKIAATSVTSGADGAAKFADPLSGAQLTVTVETADNHQPSGNISLWFASRGPDVLVMALDPAGNYAPNLQILPSQAALGAAVAAKISLTPLQAVTQSPQAWEAYLKALPDLSAWETGAQELCAPPEKLLKSLPFQSDGLLLARPDDKTLADLVSLPYYMGASSAGLLTSAFRGQAPAILRWKIGRVGANGPALAAPAGFCLWPLDRGNAQSVAAWVNYALQKKDVYPFTQLTTTDKVSYVNNLEGGQPNLAGDFLVDLDRHLVNGAQCEGYGIASDYLQVWTSGWNPLWEMKLMCYVDGCHPIDPPATSASAAFFFTKEESGWSLTSVWQNTTELWKDVYQLSLTVCPRVEAASAPPQQSEVSPMATVTLPAASCPGAPPQRVKVNGQAFVCTHGDKLLLRAEPGKSAAVVQSILNGTTLTILGGPVCADNWSFWKVQTSAGAQGWVSEGGDESDPYFICPSP